MPTTPHMFSKVSLLLCTLLLICSGSLFYPRWQNGGGEAQISWDAGGYYWYLPSTFIYHDLKSQKFKDSILQKYQPTPPNDFQYAFQPQGSQNYVVRYTIGTAILEVPGFFIAHSIARPLGFPNDGFSKPYQIAVYISGLLFALLGLWYLRKLLLFYYKDAVVAFVLFLIVVGSNYLNYAGIDVGMTHGWLFTLYVLILYNTHQFYATFKKRHVLILGFLIGITALVRPPEIIAILIPVLWGINKISIPLLKERISFISSHSRPILMALVIGCAMLSLQFIYWKWASGHWFVYTYQDQGFSWLQPHFKQYALNYQCGWLLYTPIMFFSLAGIIIFLKNGQNKIAIISLVIINYYIVASWNGWDYGGRAMVQNYPVLVFPLASFVSFIFEKKRRIWIAMPFFLICTYFNIWWTYQAHKGTLIGSAPASGSYYWNTIFRYNLPIDVQKLRDNSDEYQKPVQHLTPIFNSLLGDTIVNNVMDSVVLPKPIQKSKYLRAEAVFSIGQKEWGVWFMTQFMIQFRKGDNVLQENSIRVQRVLNDGESKRISVDAKIRHDDYDNIRILFRNDNGGSLPCRVDSLNVFLFDE